MTREEQQAERKHTPRPWSTERLPDGNVEIVVGPDAAPMAVFYGDDDDPECWPVSANARLAAAAPHLAAVVHRLCLDLASAGVEANMASLNPLESLHAEALAAYAEATGIDNPFAVAMAGVCAGNRAAIAKAEGSE